MAATLLVVEDELVVAEDLRMTLTGLGYNVPATAADSTEAIELAGKIRPDIVLMDIVLEDSELDGIRTAEKIRAIYGIPAIFITAYSDNATIDRAKTTDPFGYILKPFNIREIRSAIEIALYKHRNEQEIQKRDAILFGISSALEWFLRANVNPEEKTTSCKGHASYTFGVSDIIEHLGLAIHAANITVFSFESRESETNSMTARYVWHAFSGPATSRPSGRIPVRGALSISGFQEKLMKGETITASEKNPDDLSREFLSAMGGKSLVVLPIFRNDILWGCIGFSDDSDRHWSTEETEALRIAGSLIGVLAEERDLP